MHSASPESRPLAPNFQSDTPHHPLALCCVRMGKKFSRSEHFASTFYRCVPGGLHCYFWIFDHCNALTHATTMVCGALLHCCTFFDAHPLGHEHEKLKKPGTHFSARATRAHIPVQQSNKRGSA